jgi:hypothetical protein
MNQYRGLLVQHRLGRRCYHPDLGIVPDHRPLLRLPCYRCFADDPSLTDLDRGIYAEAIWKLGHHKNLRNRKREEVYSFFKANLRKAAPKKD